jgi:hypothetical protein
MVEIGLLTSPTRRAMDRLFSDFRNGSTRSEDAAATKEGAHGDVDARFFFSRSVIAAREKPRGAARTPRLQKRDRTATPARALLFQPQRHRCA